MRVSGYARPISTPDGKRLRRRFGACARAWNAIDSDQRYTLLTRFYPAGDVTSKFSLQRWNQLPSGLRCFIALMKSRRTADRR